MSIIFSFVNKKYGITLKVETFLDKKLCNLAKSRNLCISLI